jgi:chromosomal replication initiator protein
MAVGEAEQIDRSIGVVGGIVGETRRIAPIDARTVEAAVEPGGDIPFHLAIDQRGFKAQGCEKALGCWIVLETDSPHSAGDYKSTADASRLALPLFSCPVTPSITSRMSELWTTILPRLEGELPEQQVNTWLRPLQALEDGATLRLYAPNRYALDWVQAHAAERIRAMLGELRGGEAMLSVEVGSLAPANGHAPAAEPPNQPSSNFVEGKSNQLAKAARCRWREPGQGLQPAVHLRRRRPRQDAPDARRRPHDPARNPDARSPTCTPSVSSATWCKALQHNTMNEFKSAYRVARCAADRRHPVLRRQGPLAGRVLPHLQRAARRPAADHPDLRSLSEGSRRLEERLKSRFGWGLTVAIEPPELETCVAILISKAQAAGIGLPRKWRSSSRSASARTCASSKARCGAVIANSRFTGQPITVDFAKEALRDLLRRCRRARDDREHPEDRGGLLQGALADLLSERRTGRWRVRARWRWRWRRS